MISALFASGRHVPRSIATVNTDEVVTMAIRMASNTLKLQYGMMYDVITPIHTPGSHAQHMIDV